MTTHLLRRPRLLFLAVALLVGSVELLVVQSAAFRAQPELLGGAVVVDLILLLPILWYGLVIRRGRAPGISVVPVAVAAWLAAKALLPAAGEGWLRAASGLAPLLELGVLAYVVLRGRQIVRAYGGTASPDPVIRLREAAGEVLGRSLASRLLADEITMLRYLVRPPRTRPSRDERAFTYHRRSGWGAVVLALSMAAGVEVVAVHALVARWSLPAAWVLTALSLYGVLWLVADWRATRIRHLLLDDDRLLVGTGLRWTLSVPRESVVRIRRPSVGEDFAGDGKLSTAILQPPTVVLELGEPVRAGGPFGVARDVTLLGLTVDEPERLEEALESG